MLEFGPWANILKPLHSKQLLPPGEWEVWTCLFPERGEFPTLLPPGSFPPTAFLSATLAIGAVLIFSSVSLLKFEPLKKHGLYTPLSRATKKRPHK